MNSPAITLDDSPIDLEKPKIRRLGSKLALAAGVIAISLAGYHYGQLALFTESTDNSYIYGHVHRVGANVSGPLLEVIVDDNDIVKKGQLLARIDPREFEIMAQKAASDFEQAKARQLQAAAKSAEATAADSQAQAMITSAEAELKGTEARLDLARITLKRNETLFAGENHAVPQMEVDQSRSQVAALEAELNAGHAKIEAARASKLSTNSAIQAAEADSASAKADIDVQQAAIDEVERQKSYTEITAPNDGRIGAKNAETGNRVQVGQALFALVEEDYWIVANFKETQLKKMQMGQAVDIEIDSLGGRHFKGRIDSFAPATGAEFALLPPDNSTGNFTKVVQRVPVKITFDAESIKGFEAQLRPGLSTVVRVNLR